MLITFDGFSGAGKTTQIKRIEQKIGRAEKLHVDRPEDLPMDQLCEMLPDDITPFAKRVLSDLWRHERRLLRADIKKVNIVEWFYFHFSETNRKNLLSVWVDCLCIKPDLSFWLDLPYSESKERREKREKIILENEDVEYCANMDATVELLLEWLDAELPHFHIIDGNQSEEDVEADIQAVIRKETHGFLRN